MVVEQFIRDSDNLIKLTLTEDDIAVSGTWTALDIFLDDALFIHRTVDGNGVTLNTVTGVLTIAPGDLTAPEKAAFALLAAGHNYPVEIVVTSATNDDGAVFGGTGSERLYFSISDNPL